VSGEAAASERDPASERARRVAAYDEVAKAATLLDLRLVSSKFYAKPEYYVANTQEDADGKPFLKRGFTWRHEALGYDPEGGILSGFFFWQITVRKGRSKLLDAEATYLVSYAKVPPVEDDPALAFLRKVGRFATYPYFRAYVAEMSWASSADLPTLPVLRE
jgi:hypothetical protein